MDPIIWPTRLLVPANVKLSLENTSRGGGAGINGGEQIVVSPAARWAITFGGIAIRNPGQVRAWRAIEAQADGRANALAVPVYDRARAPSRAALVPFGDRATFSDGGRFLSPGSRVELTANAPLNATKLSVAWIGPMPDAGQHFSLGTELHRVSRIAVTSASTADLTVRPWLRAPYSVGTPLNFDDPVCKVRLATDDAMALDLELWRFATPSVAFVEYF